MKFFVDRADTAEIKLLKGTGLLDGITTDPSLVAKSRKQAILAAKAGASFVSLFIGRLDDIGQTGMELIADMVQSFRNYAFKTEVPVASVRHPVRVVQAAKLGAHVATLSPAALRQLFNPLLTEKALAALLAYWVKTGQRIA
jgi:transaldolase